MKKGKAGAEEPPPLFVERPPLEARPLAAREMLEALRQAAEERPLEPAVVKDLALRFAVLDRDEDGLLGFEELCALLTAMGCAVEGEEELLRELYELVREEGKEGVEVETAQLFLLRERYQRDVEGELKRVFSRLEQLNEGAATTAIFRELLLYHGYRYSEEQADELLRFADPAGSGRIDLAKLAELISRTDAPKKKPKAKKK